METCVIVFLGLIIIMREVIHHITLHKLINKLMSRTFADYQHSVSIPLKQAKSEGIEADLNLAHFEQLNDLKSTLGM